MSSYVSGNRLRTHMASGTFGVGGTALGAGGEIAIAHGFPTGGPTMYGVTLATSSPATTVQTNRTAYCRVSGLVLNVLVVSVLGTVCASVTATGIWWAKM